MHRFYAPPQNISLSSASLDTDETRHLRDVLRLKPDAEVNLFDGEGNEYACVITEIGKKQTTLAVIRGVAPSAPESPLDLTLAACQLPGENFDLVLQKAVELGIKQFVPLESRRTESRGGGEKRRLRWEKIALGATKQCGRADIMKVRAPVRFDEFAAGLDHSRSVYFFTERDGGAFPVEDPGKNITAFVGPKGGWDDAEIELAERLGFALITFGGRILRAETAAISVAALLQHRFGDFN